MVNKTSIKVEIFCGNSVLTGTKVVSEKFSPRWCRIYIKTSDQIPGLISILKESQHRISEAIANGENTGYFSGGQPFGQQTGPNDEDDSTTEMEPIDETTESGMKD